MLGLFFWWLSVETVGLVAFPISFLALKNLPDRGYFLSKPLGILIVSYLLWLAATFHILPNSRGTIILILFVLAGASFVIFTRNISGFKALWQERKRTIVFIEVLFTLAFLLAAFVRAYNPEISGTEKPMEFAFLNSILRSDYFPPRDPWLSGFSISYYYFGYLMMAVLTRLSGVVPGIAFNLALSTLFALTVTGAFGICFALIWHSRKAAGARPGLAPYAGGVLASLFVTVVGNLEGTLEFLRSHSFGDLSLWVWIDIKDLGPAYQSLQWYPTDPWFWWRATRVIASTSNGVTTDYTITEFPFFSYLLGDLHPHVLALPFVFLALGLALNLFFSPDKISADWLRRKPHEVLFAGLVLGALGFLNSWDFPTYSAVFVGVLLLKAYAQEKTINWQVLKSVLAMVFPVMIVGVILYLPFYLGFRSQASGILPVHDISTRPFHFFVVWGFFLVIFAGFFITKLLREKPWQGIRTQTYLVSLALVLAPLAGWAVFDIALTGAQGAPGNPVASVMDKVSKSFFYVFLAWVTLSFLFVESRRKSESEGTSVFQFVALLAFIGTLLLLGCELFFVKDVFGNRMNTVFKFYYQAWVLVALACAFGLYYFYEVWSQITGIGRATILIFCAATALLFFGVMFYPAAAIMNKTNAFAGTSTLDGLDFVKRSNPADLDATLWLSGNAKNTDIILESVGGEYSDFARVSTRTGLSTVLGWAGHELQWRGNDRDFKGREADIDEIYRSQDRNRVMELLKTYNIRYLYVGHLEKSKYGSSVAEKFRGLLEIAYQNEGTVVFQVS